MLFILPWIIEVGGEWQEFGIQRSTKFYKIFGIHPPNILQRRV